MTTPAIKVTGAATAAGSPAPNDHHAFGFRDILSALNPLQYLPVVGTIYRAVTGDVIPESLRFLGSLLVSGVLGGPIGVAISLAATAAEKVTGVDPEKIVTAQLNSAPAPKIAQGISPGIPLGTAIRPGVPAINPPSVIAPTRSASARFAMTPGQLAAYGVRVDTSGTPRLGDIRGADVLNAIELGRHARASAAYAANQPAA
jgi:hypothetical protein